LNRKGVQDLAQAYLYLHNRGFEIPLSIVGFGKPVDEVLKAFDPLVRKGIRIDSSLQLLDEEALMREYRGHEILVFPSLYEGFGLVFLEAMASQLALVVTPVGGVVDLIRHEENGVVVPPRDPQALAGAIIDLWQSPNKRLRLGKSAFRTARLHTWNVIAQRTVECYKMAAGCLPQGEPS
jgi:glycosyltransferase involved in cell wall biosynthesis